MKKKKLVIFISLLFLTLLFITIKSYFIFNNTNWKLVAWNVSSLDPQKSEVTLNFKGFRISGNGGVNLYSGYYLLGLDKRISFKDITSTLIASTDSDINKAEMTYFKLLNQVKYYKLENNYLRLLDKNKNEMLTFEKK